MNEFLDNQRERLISEYTTRIWRAVTREGLHTSFASDRIKIKKELRSFATTITLQVSLNPRRPTKLLHRLQNSPFTRWMWRYYLSRTTGKVSMVPFWKVPPINSDRMNIKE
jgi:hypothetical protein